MSIILTLLFGFLLGFFLGRRKGIREGEEIGASYTPIKLREKSLESGVCALCKTSVDCLKSTSVIE